MLLQMEGWIFANSFDRIQIDRKPLLPSMTVR
jgi:hypothetical protein